MAIAVASIDTPPDKANIHPMGDLRIGLFQLTFTGNYVSGGEVVTPTFESLFKQLGEGKVYFVNIAPGDGNGGYVLRYDYTNKKVYTLYSDNNNAADGPFIEIPAAAYPAAITAGPIRAMVLGR